MSTPIIFVGTAPTPTTGADTVNHGPHDAASIDQNMENLRSVLDGKMPLAGSAGQAFTIGVISTTAINSSGIYSISGSDIGIGSQRWFGSDATTSGLLLNVPTGGGLSIDVNNTLVGRFSAAGLNIPALAGTGTRHVVVDADGNLSAP